jgi:uroporphyrinogen III methyltransferase / synthase
MRVYIVGAGPGDPSLISVRGLRYLEQADVVVHDHKVDERLLRLAPKAAERIDVGAAAPKPLDQDAISYLVAEKAREGKIVVRLKWGDPFVFDSGGKEAIFLHEQRIPFEVVPGIPVAVAGSAYAGVPITYPEAGDTVVLVRGNEAETDVPAQVDWASVAAIGGTILCFAGARQIDAITRALLTNGKSPEEAAVLVYDATRPSQQTVQAPLGEIAGAALADRPALLIVGPVAGLRDHLRWFDARPLFGRRIVVTRSREQSGELIVLLEDLGAEIVSIPTIRIEAPEDMSEMDAACDAAEAFDWIVFTSVNGVEHFMRRFVARRDIRELKGVKVCAVGPETAAELQGYGIRTDLTPEEYRAEALIAALGDVDDLRGKRVLLPRAQIAREVLADELKRAGADVTELVAYRTLAETETDSQDVYRMLLDRKIDAVTFTSASTVRNFVQMLGGDQAADLLQGTTVAAIGPVTAEAAQQLGIATAVVPERYTVPAMVNALVEHFRSQSAPVEASR